MSYHVPTLVAALGGGSLVLGSYAWAYRSHGSRLKSLWGSVLDQPRMLRWWGLTAMLAAASFLYLLGWMTWCVDEDQATVYGYQWKDEGVWFYFSGYLLLVLSAMMWTYTSVRSNTEGSFLSVWLTALASVILWCNVLFTEDTGCSLGLTNLASAAGVFLVIQHLFWDAIIWRESFDGLSLQACPACDGRGVKTIYSGGQPVSSGVCLRCRGQKQVRERPDLDRTDVQCPTGNCNIMR